MDRMLPFDEEERRQYEDVMLLMDEIRFLRRVWNLMPNQPLTHSDMMLLGHIKAFELHEECTVTVSKLAAHMKQSMPGISQKASVLEKQGYLRRDTSAADRRVVSLALTEKGREATDTALRAFYGRLQAVLDDLGKENTKTLLGLLECLHGSIDRLQAEEDDNQA